MQNITSKNTALTQVASTFKKFDFSNSYVLDWGCGKGLSKEFCEKNFDNCKVELFDPFHNFKSGVENYCLFSLSAICDSKYDNKIITCNNVLNVLQDNTLIDVLNGVFACAMVCKVDRVIFKIYQGDKTGLGRITKKDCYQRNEKTGAYVEKINSFSKVSNAWNIRKSGLYIICDRK